MERDVGVEDQARELQRGQAGQRDVVHPVDVRAVQKGHAAAVVQLEAQGVKTCLETSEERSVRTVFISVYVFVYISTYTKKYIIYNI